MRAIRAIFDQDRGHHDSFARPPASLRVYLHLRSAAPSAPATAKAPKPGTPALRDAPSFDIVGEERVLQDVVDEVLVQGVRIAGAFVALSRLL
ncbi:hypothetical protein EI94DRAFT_1806383 [Lactarius quietus]|nr:hypothetical protein EI94DRAFT_1806383 [Lactarius quietus]